MLAGGAVAAVAGGALALRHRMTSQVKRLTRDSAFASTPALVPHDPATERRTLHVARGKPPADNIDAVLDQAGLAQLIGEDDLVILKVSAQWWNQGMTNVAAARRAIQRILDRPNFRGEVVVFENTHFRLADGSGLSRAFTRPSERNVDVPGWASLGDLVAELRASGKPVSAVGLIDAAASELKDDPWHDPGHAHGVYGGDGRGPIAAGEVRDGYRWALDRSFARKRGWFETTRAPLTWPVFTSPRSGLQVDLADGVFELKGGQRTRTSRKLTWISMVTVNEHASTGMTACCKSAMGVVDMSAGKLGTDPRTAAYNSIHYFGNPEATWRMAGPLAHFAREVRAPDLYLAVAEWVAIRPAADATWDDDAMDARLAAESAHRANTIIAGADPVAIDYWAAKNVLTPIATELGARGRGQFDVTDPDSKLSRFLRDYRQVYKAGTMTDELISVA
ncbi:MAG TPA: DUF362 domain-containing protein [Kofleriaceae bacterium]